MLSLGPLAFTAPWLLLALVLLPILWLLLRAVPPAPVRRRFPGVALLLGLRDEETRADTTPWWLLLLRALAVGLVILGLAGPILNPEPAAEGTGPVLILADATFADAPGWADRLARIEAEIERAERAGRPAALALATDPPPGAPEFQAAGALRRSAPGLQPSPYAPDPQALAAWAASLEGRFETLWLSDGLDWPGRAELLAALEARGPVRVFEGGRALTALRPPVAEDGAIAIAALRPAPGPEREARVLARGPGPDGVERVLAEIDLAFEDGASEARGALSLPPELRNRVARFEIEGARSAAGVQMVDDALRRREVALVSGAGEAEGLRLLSPLHYLREALAPSADLIEGSVMDVLPANPDVIVLADVAQIPEAAALREWVEGGGLLLRFAGPRLAASEAGRGAGEDPLMPVPLRAGGRAVGGAMSWGEPKALAPFPEDGPFAGLAVPEEVLVSAQVMAEPGPDLAQRTLARLADGTPLVTRVERGAGQVVLFHVTANAEWSGLPLSGLFVRMLDRLAVSAPPQGQEAAEIAGRTWTPEVALDAFGVARDAGERPGVPGEALVAGASAQAPPGLYAGGERRVALNVIGADTALAPAAWPARIPVEGPQAARETPLGGWLLAAALALLAADALAALLLMGRLGGRRAGVGAGAGTAAALALGAALGLAGAPAEAQEGHDAAALAAATEVVLAHVLTGDAQVDEMARAGLAGLSRTLWRRTSIEPADPAGIDPETDELSVYPFLYWPVTPGQALPSEAAYAKLNRYLRTGGMILFDTRDAHLGGRATPEAQMLQRLAAPLDVPPLERLPDDHVLTRAFYLLQDFPGRHASREVWVEAAPPDAERVEGMPFRNLNDGVTPVIIGPNDWASAWAEDAQGRPLVPVGRGYAGERQREIALRFGVNLIMHVLTGNYKSDQVHVPALLDRLGQ